ncbi:UDP-N-acetylmuramoyl-L-alanine--D-glutamate ligase [Desulfosediminicola ganghwensis]|uniref:UDP-N-acetylmuramoyl-L-alanine--D-glutamate ligase n=1 Tax=Desulfosediminicola ganghwensis TaxID=2569540 RepID=UPI0010AC0811|nr:UDP-N-acetylmuramoyl-L-alanine--D-glutamate ligase [Desulfosediminicola ganghwensis]
MHEELKIKPGMKVGVIGLGVTGRAMVRYCLGLGAELFVSDNRSAEQLVADEAELLENSRLQWEAGGHTLEFLQQADMVVASPGIPQDHNVILGLTRLGIPVVGELAVAAPSLSMKVVAVTGTNGKTTVTALIGEILAQAGINVFVGGNIGTPLVQYLHEGGNAEVMVLELSSFQLLMAGTFAPQVAVLLNITPDHIDRHGSLEEYAAAKMRVFANQKAADTAIINGDDPLCVQLADKITSNCLKFGTSGDQKQYAAQIKGNEIWLSGAENKECYDLAGTVLANKIGAQNAAAAILAVKILGLTHDQIMAGLRSFTPAPHRLQQVTEHRGVLYVDDSKATNTGAAIAALEQLSGKAVLIAGGREKGEDYSMLKAAIRDKAKDVVLIGEAAEKMKTSFNGAVPLHMATTMADAVRKATQLAKAGDTVLLSPACASFDMFNSYGHRGQVFSEEVLRLVAEQSAEKMPDGGENDAN